ncbi:MAG: hypothetical protein AAGF85_08910 [Bacteroidota bacterium]
MNLDSVMISIKNKYKIRFETLEIKDGKNKITQSIQGDWTRELIQEAYDKVTELKRA